MSNYARNTLMVALPVAIVLSVAACGGSSADDAASPAAEATPTTEMLTADITLTSSTPVTLGYVDGDECGGMGNDAMEEGKQYRIEGGGETLVLGELPAGVAVDVPSGVDCYFEFTAEVPAGLGFYTIDMGEFQGSMEVSEQDLASGVQIDRIDMEGRQ